MPTAMLTFFYAYSNANYIELPIDTYRSKTHWVMFFDLIFSCYKGNECSVA